MRCPMLFNILNHHHFGKASFFLLFGHILFEDVLAGAPVILVPHGPSSGFNDMLRHFTLCLRLRPVAEGIALEVSEQLGPAFQQRSRKIYIGRDKERFQIWHQRFYYLVFLSPQTKKYAGNTYTIKYTIWKKNGKKQMSPFYILTSLVATC